MRNNVTRRGFPSCRQSGAALLVFAALLVMLSAGVLVERLSSRVQLNADRDRNTSDALAEAKASLIAWAVSHPNEPGRLPWPDRNGDGNYDGQADCVSQAIPPNPFNDGWLLGRFPYAGDATPCNTVAFGSFQVDGAGEPLWYAVSRNLLWNRGQAATDPSINPGLLDGAASYPWLTVRDANGSVLSNEIAAVIIAPGAAIGAQARSGAAPDPSQYLDSVTVGGTPYDNSDADLDFIVYPDSRTTPAEDDSFNDRLVYITIDELMPKVEKRVIGEAAVSLRTYWNDSTTWVSPPPNPAFPWLRPFADPQTATNFDSQVNTREGLLPLHQPNGAFSTGFTLEWSAITGADITTSGSVTAGELTDGPAGGVAVAEAPDNCTWSDAPGPTASHRRSVFCSGAVTEDTGCTLDVILAQSLCTRQTWTFNLYHTADPDPSVTAPSATDVRRRTVAHSGALPVHPGGSPMITLVEEEQLIDANTGLILEDWSTTGTGTLTTQAGTAGTVATSGVRYDLDYVNDLEIPQWFVDNLWHHYLYAAMSADDAPDGGGNCDVSGNCVSVDVGGSIAAVPNARAVVVSAGRELTSQNRANGAVDDYYEYKNNDGIDAGNPAERGPFRADFNDQVRIVATSP